MVGATRFIAPPEPGPPKHPENFSDFGVSQTIATGSALVFPFFF